MLFRKKPNRFKMMVMLYKTFRRWSVLKKLQQQILQGSTPHQMQQAFEKYLDLCVSEANIAPFMNEQPLTRNDLKRIYHALQETSLGRWKDEHYLALSTIAYLEPLAYFVISEKQGQALDEIVSVLQEYWAGDIARGALIEKVQPDASP